MNVGGLVGLFALILGFAGLYYFTAIRPDQKNAKSLQQLGARRGWRIERRLARAGKGMQIEIAPAEGAWKCLVTRYFKSGGGSAVRTTEFEDANVRLAAGMIAIGPALGGPEAAAASRLLARSGASPSGMALSALLGDVASEASGLAPVPVEPAMALTAFATSDAPGAEIAAAYAALLEDWRRMDKAAENFPILLVSAKSLRVRMRADASEAGLLEAFIDHACAAAALVAKPTPRGR